MYKQDIRCIENDNIVICKRGCHPSDYDYCQSLLVILFAK